MRGMDMDQMKMMIDNALIQLDSKDELLEEYKNAFRAYRKAVARGNTEGKQEMQLELIRLERMAENEWGNDFCNQMRVSVFRSASPYYSV